MQGGGGTVSLFTVVLDGLITKFMGETAAERLLKTRLAAFGVRR